MSTVDNNVDKTNETMNNPCTLSTNYNVLISGSSIFNNRTMDDKVKGYMLYVCFFFVVWCLDIIFMLLVLSKSTK